MSLARSRAMARDGAWEQALVRALNSGHRSVGTLTARLRIRCARQRCRAERGKHSSIARMIPGAPSETTSSGAPRPRPRMSWKKARTVSVSSFDPAIRCSRHAVAIDQVRNEFEPTLWTNLEELNGAAGATADDLQAPYQQKWFPGVHSSVGGGADWRGLSDQTLHWVWIGAMQKGSKFDTSQNSRIFELAPKFMDRLVHGDDPSLSYRVMAARGTSRQNGPKHLHEVSYSAQRRWHESPDMLAEGTLYRPETLNSVARQLDKLDPMQFGVGPKYRKSIATLNTKSTP